MDQERAARQPQSASPPQTQARAAAVSPDSGGAERLARRIWSSRNPAALLLWPLSLLFRAAAALRRAAYRAGLLSAWTASVPVVIVGNLCVGGAGKTPVVIALARALRAAGLRPAVLSRGYGAAAGAVRRVQPQSPAAEVGDEPLLIARSLAGDGAAHGAGDHAAPGAGDAANAAGDSADADAVSVWIGRDRAAAARAALAADPRIDVLLCDDGLQHYALARKPGRDIEIVVADARLHGNRFALPAGPMREPESRRRDFTVERPALTLGAARRLGDPRETLPLAEIAARRRAGLRVLAAAGIAWPEKFFASLREAGVEPDAVLALPDHYAYARTPFAGHPAGLILMTEKDAVKCAASDEIRKDPRIWTVPAEAALPPGMAQAVAARLLAARNASSATTD
ncbi:MAG: tetraacyldisaccharide 4'-kinase [Candidatus Protistobacter heckmanni]|nr:tetraacyldisaccharide 4'-kinase [Candidatus Protistobacter heckmanni]